MVDVIASSSLVEMGLGALVTGGFLAALETIGNLTFGLLPTGLFGLGTVLIGAGLYERFVLKK